MTKISKKIIGIACLLSCSTSLLASTIECKQIPNTLVTQCVSKGGDASNLYGLTKMPYALCSKALCTLSVTHPGKARCVCSLYSADDWSSLSISPTNYEKSKPTWNKQHKLLTVQSNYSLANMVAYPHTKAITCHFKRSKPWADCFGVRCKVTGTNTAVCMCPVNKNKNFDITGPGTAQKCVTKSDRAWSAIKATQTNNDFVQGLYDELYPNAPVKANQ